MSIIESSYISKEKISTSISDKRKHIGPNLNIKNQHLILLLKHESPKGSFTEDIIPKKHSLSSKEIKISYKKLLSSCCLEKIKEFKSLAKMIPKYDERTNDKFIKNGLVKLIKHELSSPESIEIIKFECIRILIGLIESSVYFHSTIDKIGFINTLHKFRRNTKDPILCETYELVRCLMKKHHINH